MLLVLELSVGIAAAAKKDKISSVASLAWGQSTDETKGYFEQKFDCCGFYNTTDRAYEAACPQAKVGSSAAEDACSTAITSVIEKVMYKVSVAALVIAFFEVGTMVCTFALARRIKDASGGNNGYSSVSQNTFGDDEEDDDGDDGAVISDVKFGNDDDDDNNNNSEDVDFFALSKDHQDQSF